MAIAHLILAALLWPALTPAAKGGAAYVGLLLGAAVLGQVHRPMPRQFCAEPGCGVLVDRGRCDRHARDRFVNAEYAHVHRWYTSARWQRLRLAVLQEDPLCRECLMRGVKTPTTDIDHVLKHDGDPVLFWNRANLQGLCRACHARKTTRGE